MSVSLSMLGAQVAAASPSPSPSPSSSGFTWGDALTIFILVIVGLLILLAFVGRRTKRLTYRPRLQTEHERTRHLRRSNHDQGGGWLLPGRRR